MFNAHAEPFIPYDPKTGFYMMPLASAEITAPERYIDPNILGEQAEFLETPAGRAKKAFNAFYLAWNREYREDLALQNLIEERYEDLRNVHKPKVFAPYKNPVCHPKGQALARLKAERAAQDAANEERQQRRHDQILTAIEAMRVQREMDLESLRNQSGKVSDRVDQLETQQCAMIAAQAAQDLLIGAHNRQLAQLATQITTLQKDMAKGNLSIAEMQVALKGLQQFKDRVEKKEWKTGQAEKVNLVLLGKTVAEAILLGGMVVVAGPVAIPGVAIAAPLALLGTLGMKFMHMDTMSRS
jgi:hypothetical protein